MSGAGDLALTVGFTSVRDSIGSLMTGAKDWSRWLGYEVVKFSVKGVEVAKIGVQALISLIIALWNASRPYLSQMLAFLGSRAGFFSIGILATCLILHKALNDDNLADRTQRYAWGLAAVFSAFSFGAFGAQAGFLPKFV